MSEIQLGLLARIAVQQPITHAQLSGAPRK